MGLQKCARAYVHDVQKWLSKCFFFKAPKNEIALYTEIVCFATCNEESISYNRIQYEWFNESSVPTRLLKVIGQKRSITAPGTVVFQPMERLSHRHASINILMIDGLIQREMMLPLAFWDERHYFT